MTASRRLSFEFGATVTQPDRSRYVVTVLTSHSQQSSKAATPLDAHVKQHFPQQTAKTLNLILSEFVGDEEISEPYFRGP